FPAWVEVEGEVGASEGSLQGACAYCTQSYHGFLKAVQGIGRSTTLRLAIPPLATWSRFDSILRALPLQSGSPSPPPGTSIQTGRFRSTPQWRESASWPGPQFLESWPTADGAARRYAFSEEYTDRPESAPRA